MPQEGIGDRRCNGMAEVVTLPGRWSYDVAVATPPRLRVHPAGLEHLPSEWSVVDDVTLRSGAHLDHVIVGPNGLFTVAVDPETIPADIGEDGLYRHGIARHHTGKARAAWRQWLGRTLGLGSIAYPILVTAIRAPRHHLDRLGVVPGERIAEHIWSHPGLPLRRSQRAEVLWALRRFSG